MNLICRDIKFSDAFYSDYDSAPENIQRRITRLVEMVAQSGKIPASVQAHRAFDSHYIGYVTTSRTAWRILFTIEEDVMIIDRLYSHKDQDSYLRNMV